MMSDVKEFVQHVYKGHKKKRSLSIVFDWNIRILKSLSSEEECSWWEVNFATQGDITDIDKLCWIFLFFIITFLRCDCFVLFVILTCI